MRVSLRELAIMAGTGSLAGTLGDRFHTAYDVLRYPQPIWQQEAWFVPFLFAAAGIAMGVGHRWLRGILSAAPCERRFPTLVVGLLFFWACYIPTAALGHAPVLVTVLLVAAFILRAWLGGSRVDVVHVLATAIIGTGVEALLIRMGHFEYLATSAGLAVPCWLPALYLHGALIAGHLDDALERAHWPAADPV